MKHEYIPLVHNYCDRWCERCTVRSRCRLFAEDPGMALVEEHKEHENQAFWDYLAVMLSAANECARKISKECGLEESFPDDYDFEEDGMVEFEFEAGIKENFESELQFTPQALSVIASDYGNQVWEWLQGNKERFVRLKQDLDMINENSSKIFSDALEVIRWYGQFIMVKVERALLVLNREFEMDAFDRFTSAKIALIAVNRTMGAFSTLIQWWHSDDEILVFLSKLTDMNNAIITIFPETVEMSRPGFED